MRSCAAFEAETNGAECQHATVCHFPGCRHVETPTVKPFPPCHVVTIPSPASAMRRFLLNNSHTDASFTHRAACHGWNRIC